MDGKSQYQSKNLAIAPFLMLYFNNPATSIDVEPENEVNSLSYFQNHEKMYEGDLMKPQEVRDIILNPDHYEDEVEKFMMVDDDGVCYPGHLPLIEDLFGYSAVFNTILNREIEALAEQKSDLILPPYLCAAIDPKPTLDFKAPIFAIGNLPIRMSFGSYTDAFQVNQFFCNIQVAEVTVFHSTIVDETKDGVQVKRNRRYHDVRITPVYTYKYCIKPMPLREGSKFVTWNVRGVSRPSFLENFEKLCTTYHPVLFILVESRISDNNMAWLMTRLASNWDHTMFGNFSVKGGPVVFIFDKTKVKIMDFLHENDPWLASVRVQGVPRSTLEKEKFV